VVVAVVAVVFVPVLAVGGATVTQHRACPRKRRDIYMYLPRVFYTEAI
jgi:hypothetical protein